MKPSITSSQREIIAGTAAERPGRQKEQRRKTRAGRRERQRFWKKEDWLP